MTDRACPTCGITQVLLGGAWVHLTTNNLACSPAAKARSEMSKIRATISSTGRFPEPRLKEAP